MTYTSGSFSQHNSFTSSTACNKLRTFAWKTQNPAVGKDASHSSANGEIEYTVLDGKDTSKSVSSPEVKRLSEKLGRAQTEHSQSSVVLDSAR